MPQSNEKKYTLKPTKLQFMIYLFATVFNTLVRFKEINNQLKSAKHDLKYSLQQWFSQR